MIENSKIFSHPKDQLSKLTILIHLTDKENNLTEAEFKELQTRLKFKLRLKCSWFHKIVFNVSRFKPAFN